MHGNQQEVTIQQMPAQLQYNKSPVYQSQIVDIEQNQLYDQSAQDRKNKILQFVYSIVPFTIMMGILIFFEVDQSLKHKLIDYFSNIQELNVQQISIILGIGVSLIIINAPFVLFELCLGYTFNYGLAMSLTISSKFIGESICFLATKYLFKNYFLRIFQNNEMFQIINKATQEHPWQIQHILRANALMPLFVINFGSGLLQVGYLQFIVPAIFWGALYSSASIYGGNKIHSIQNIMNKKIKWKHMEQGSNFMEYFEIFSVVLGVLLLVLIYFISRKYYEKLKLEIQNEKKNSQNQIDFQFQQFVDEEE